MRRPAVIIRAGALNAATKTQTHLFFVRAVVWPALFSMDTKNVTYTHMEPPFFYIVLWGADIFYHSGEATWKLPHPQSNLLRSFPEWPSLKLDFWRESPFINVSDMPLDGRRRVNSQKSPNENRCRHSQWHIKCSKSFTTAICHTALVYLNWLIFLWATRQDQYILNHSVCLSALLCTL
jgi:hypothetical protein